MDDTELPPSKRQRTDDEENEIKENVESMNVAHNDAQFAEDINDSQFVENQDKKYQDFVTPEEIEKLKEFHVLDEVKSDDEGSENDDSEDEKSDVPEEEIDRMLDDGLPEELRVPKQKEKPYVTRQKIVLEEKGINHFEVLPLDWIVVRHYSGMPVYMHRPTRVCTLAKPYFIGKENTRCHDIPISAIPCYNYRRALQEEEKQTEIDRRIAEQIRTGAWEKNIPGNEEGASVGTKSGEASELTEEVSSTQDSEDKTVDAVEESETEKVFKCPYAVNKSQDNDNEADGNENNEEIPPIVQSDDTENVEAVSSQTDVADQSEVPRRELSSPNGVEHEFKCPYPVDRVRVSKKSNEENQIGCEQNTYLSKNIKNEASGSPFDQISKGNEVAHEGSTSKEFGVISTERETNGLGVGEQTEDEKEQEIQQLAKPLVLPGGVAMAPPRVETLQTSWKTKLLTPEDLNQYCSKLFKFKTINIMHFKRWADRRKYALARKSLQYPALPRGSQLITIPAAADARGGGARRDWVMNMNGRSYLSVFHEYVHRALNKQPVYEFRQLENAAAPYQATVYIGGMAYGVGAGSSKRLAKAAAARASIRVLIPDAAKHDPDAAEPDFSFFDYISIEDPRIAELCAAACEPAPHAILRTCLLRNCGAGDRHIHTEMKKLEYQKVELTMRVGKHAATVVCKNKKTAKQRASQAILQALHPHISSWGSLLRLYGSRSVKSCKEKKQEEQEITLLQDKAKHNEPNYAVLEKLKLEMRRLRERDEAVVPIGTFLVKDDLPTHSGSNLNNVEL